MSKKLKTVKDCIAAIKRLPGIQCEPKLVQTSSYVDTVSKKSGIAKAIVFRPMYHVEVASYWRFSKKGVGSWLRVETGPHPTPQKAVEEWNALVDTMRDKDLYMIYDKDPKIERPMKYRKPW